MTTLFRLTRLTRPALFAALVPFALTACSQPLVEDTAPDETVTTDSADITPMRAAFFAALSTHCGKAYPGRLVSDDSLDADLKNAQTIMYVTGCSDDRITIPFHVAVNSKWDRSRTWIITKTDLGGLLLRHDHRHEDGTPDAVTMYGGNTDRSIAGAGDSGTAHVQEFPIDAPSIALFEREGLTESITNVWSMETDQSGTADGKFVYQLKRSVKDGAPRDRLFRVEFDLSAPITPPPPAWGYE